MTQNNAPTLYLDKLQLKHEDSSQNLNEIEATLFAEGHTSKIYSFELSGEQFVLKRFKKILSEKMRKQEYTLQCSFDHPHILRINRMFASPDYSCIVLEKMLNFSLFNIVSIQNQALPVEIVAYIFKCLVAGTLHMHERGYAHRDLKLENILLHQETLEVKIADLGYAEKLGVHYVNSQIGSPRYMAPELWKSRTIRSNNLVQCDVYSLGVILYTLLHSTFPNLSQKQEIKLVKTDIEEKKEELNLKDNLITLNASLLDKNPINRYSLKQISQLSWLVDLELDKDIYNDIILERIRQCQN